MSPSRNNVDDVLMYIFRRDKESLSMSSQPCSLPYCEIPQPFMRPYDFLGFCVNNLPRLRWYILGCLVVSLTDPKERLIDLHKKS